MTSTASHRRLIDVDTTSFVCWDCSIAISRILFDFGENENDLTIDSCFHPITATFIGH